MNTEEKPPLPRLILASGPLISYIVLIIACTFMYGLEGCFLAATGPWITAAILFIAKEIAVIASLVSLALVQLSHKLMFKYPHMWVHDLIESMKQYSIIIESSDYSP